MTESSPRHRYASRTAARALLAVTVAVTVLVTGCEKESKEEAPRATATSASAVTPPPPIVASPVTQASWAPDALEELLAPIALYPDQLLMQILAASVNSQEVLDGGNWLLENQSLKGDTLDTAAGKAGFGAAMRALLQFPTVVDMLCQQIDWTRQLGSAVTSDQKSVLDAVQRLRAQATKVGNLQSTPQQTVETKTENDRVIVEVKPANPEVVYVPQYNPQAVYTTPPPAPAPTQTTTVVQDDDDTVSTESAVLGGLLAFGAGVLIGNAFDDDDDDCCYPNWGSSTVVVGARPFYPAAYAYRPAYGAGFRPAYRYAPPAGYRNNYNRNMNNNINVNNNNYYNRFSKDQNLRAGSVQSPLRTPQQLPASGARDRAAVNARGESWKGRSSYEGKPNAATSARLSEAAGTRPSAARRQETARNFERTPERERPARSSPPTRAPVERPTVDRSASDRSAPDRSSIDRSGDRGYDASGRQDRDGSFDQARAGNASPRAQDDAFSGTRARDGGSFDRAASARGRASAGGMQRREARAGGGGGRRRG